MTVTLEGEDAALFAVSSSVIGRDEENGEKDIEITFTPESEGVYNATVIFSDGKGFSYEIALSAVVTSVSGIEGDSVIPVPQKNVIVVVENKAYKVSL